jgi:two-component system sensor histidine kinase KdpD
VPRIIENQYARYVLSVLVVAPMVALGRYAHANASTQGFAFLLVVLIISATWGLRSAILFSLTATLAYNYYFLPPIGTFTIADPQNWIALFTFLLTAVIASQLSERARREMANANSGRQRACAHQQHPRQHRIHLWSPAGGVVFHVQPQGLLLQPGGARTHHGG